MATLFAADRIEEFRKTLLDPTSETERILATCELMIADGHIGEVVTLLETMSADPVAGPRARRALAMCRYLKSSGIVDDLLRFRVFDGGQIESLRPGGHDVAPSSFLSRRDGSKKLIVVFTGKAHRFWVSLEVFHQFLTRLDQHILYLRDDLSKAYLAGVPEFGEHVVGRHRALLPVSARERNRARGAAGIRR